MDKYIGKRLDGRYEVQELVGVGGMAYVYKGVDLLEGRTVAIKILKEEYAENDDFVRRFKNESKAISDVYKRQCWRSCAPATAGGSRRLSC